MIGIGVIGYGYWGPNLVRNFMECPESKVVCVSDLRPDRLSLAKRRHPAIDVTADCFHLLNHPRVDAVVIATPVSTHGLLGLEALRAGKHVLVEKPLTSTSTEAMRLIDEAGRRNLTLMVDHTFVYTGAVRKIRELIDRDELGQVYYYDSVRVNLGLFQHDVNVIWDLAVHDIAIIDYIKSARPTAVSATGISHIPGNGHDIAYITAFFGSNFIAHIHVNWLAPVKVRRSLIGGSKKMIVYDDLEASEKIKIYDKGITVNNGPETVHKILIGYRTGDMWAPKLDMTEALTTEAAHFVRCVEGKERPVVDGETGLRVVRILEAATVSMEHRGELVELAERRTAA